MLKFNRGNLAGAQEFGARIDVGVAEVGFAFLCTGSVDIFTFFDSESL